MFDLCLATVADKADCEQSGGEERERSRLRHVGDGIAGFPHLGARIASRVVGEVGGEIRVITGAERRVGNEIVRAEPTGPGDVELQVAKIRVARTIAFGAIDGDAEGAKWGVVAIARAQAENAEGV